MHRNYLTSCCLPANQVHGDNGQRQRTLQPCHTATRDERYEFKTTYFAIVPD